jgi:large subunit ribosomal protein L10
MRSEKTILVEYIGGLIENSAFLYFVNYKGLTVEAFSDFRGKLATNGAKCHVLKNRLISKAAEQVKADALASYKMVGDTAVIFGQGDPGAVAKVIAEFAKVSEPVVVKGGFLDNVMLSENDVKIIADLPPREVLLAQLLGVLEGPKRNLVTVLNNSVAQIVNVLNNYQSKLEEN